jgi:arylsulfatase A-like enzyme
MLLRATAALTAALAALAAPQPHIFVFVIDDFGRANFGPNRDPSSDPTHEVQTPNMDALVAQGILLERSYVYWYCSPSRSALQTGRNPIHVNMNNDDMMLVNPADPVGGFQGIARNFTGIGTKLSSVGYETHFYGKWHVGAATEDHTPTGRGWQNHMIVRGESAAPSCTSARRPTARRECKACTASLPPPSPPPQYFDGANDFWTSQSGSCAYASGKKDMPLTDLWRNGAPARALNNSWQCSQAHQPASCVYEDSFFLNETLHAIRSRNPAKPFAAIWAPHNIHAPLQVPQAYAQKFAFIDDPRRALYAAKVNFLDDQLGLVVQALKDAGMWASTFFVGLADNGGPIYDSGEAGANNWPLKGGKTSNHEGGVRGNAFVSGGLIPPARRGAREAGLISIEDWYPTICGLAGAPVADARAAAAGLPPVDGVDLWPLLSGLNATSPRTEVVLGMPTISSALSIGDPYTGVQALIRSDGWKLIIGVTHQNVHTSPDYPNASTKWANTPADCGDSGCLYNVFTDPSEYSNVAAANPGIAAALRARIAHYNATVYRPNRGTSDAAAACPVLLGQWGGFWGPWRA